MKYRTTLFLLSFFLMYHCHAFKILTTFDDYVYELYEPEDEIPLSILQEAVQMYFEAYLFPKWHEGISLAEMNIDPTRFSSYEEYIADMFHRDFLSYQSPHKRYYFQIRHACNAQIIGVCVLLENGPGFYYKDHLGIHRDFRRKGLAFRLIEEAKKALPHFVEISLDTRVFNRPSQGLYQKAGFTKLETHPIKGKQSAYFHYIFRNP